MTPDDLNRHSEDSSADDLAQMAAQPFSHGEEEMVAGYIECALWSEQDWRAMHEAGEDNPPPLDDVYGPDDLEAETRAEMVSECRAFADANSADIDTVLNGLDGYTWGNVGHDFLLTRNGHGAGFWDRTYEEGEVRKALLRLSEACEGYGSFNLDSTAEGTVTSL